ncbi:MAG: aspartate aminotransferase family protein, partial [Euryarchaeota archaeon]|nr:aspartate aminotransferase family protein [Euryarchaeota archaeon]
MQPVHARSDHRPVSTVVDPFASPHQLDPALRQFLHSASDQLTQWLGSAAEASPLPLVRPQPQISPSQEGADMQSLLDDLQTVMDGAFQPSHPGSLAHLDPPPLTASIAAELICAGLNNNLLAEELSPGLSNLEQQLCGWFCSRLGLPEQSGGVLASGGTLSNLMGLVVARS